MKKLSIYIDYAGEEGKLFALDLVKRLNALDNVVAQSYDDVVVTNSEGEEVEWEKNTLSAMSKADMVIPLLSEKYLSYVSDKIQVLFDKIIESKNKFLIPILHQDSDWSSYNWVVKSKIYPEDGIALSNHSINVANSTINEVIKAVKNVRADSRTPVPSK